MTAIIHGEFQPENLNQKSADTVPLPSIRGRGGSRGEQGEPKISGVSRLGRHPTSAKCNLREELQQIMNL